MAKKKSTSVPPTLEAQNEAFSKLRQTSLPVTAKQLSGMLVAPFKISEALLIPILDAAVANGELHGFLPATAKGKPRFWDRDLTEFGRCLIVQSIQKKGPQPKAKLKSAAKGLTDEMFQQAFEGLIGSHRLCEHPPVGKSKISKYGIESPACEPYFKDVGKQLAKIVEQLIAVGVDRTSLTDAIVVWLAQSGLSVTTASERSNVPASTGVGEIDLLMLMRQIEPGAERGALVTSRELRHAANLDKPLFDQVVLNLAREGRLMLHRHDHATGLSPSERDELVTDGSGTYYVGMALRRSEG